MIGRKHGYLIYWANRSVWRTPGSFLWSELPARIPVSPNSGSASPPSCVSLQLNSVQAQARTSHHYRLRVSGQAHTLPHPECRASSHRSWGVTRVHALRRACPVQLASGRASSAPMPAIRTHRCITDLISCKLTSDQNGKPGAHRLWTAWQCRSRALTANVAGQPQIGSPDAVIAGVMPSDLVRTACRASVRA